MKEKIKPGRGQALLGEIDGVKLSIEREIAGSTLTDLILIATYAAPHLDIEDRIFFDFASMDWNHWDAVPQKRPEFWAKVKALLLERIDVEEFKRDFYFRAHTRATDLVDHAQKHLIAVTASKDKFLDLLKKYQKDVSSSN